MTTETQTSTAKFRAILISDLYGLRFWRASKAEKYKKLAERLIQEIRDKEIRVLAESILTE